MAADLDDIFDNFDKNNIFKNKDTLQIKHTPNDIPHREAQIKQVASILAPVLRGERPSNLFLYGMTGTGKTLSIQYVRDELLKRMNPDVDFDLNIILLNCKIGKIAETEYRILAKIIEELGGEVASTGLPTEAVYRKFVQMVDLKKQLVVIILDEIDQLIKKIDDDFLYNLSRLNSELSQSKISIIGISNDTSFLNHVNPRVKSSLSEEEIVFPPYNAIQLQDILKKRSEESFKDGILEEGVIAKCAAYAARVDGDARRALDLLRVAGELAERDGCEKVRLEHIDSANDKIERDKILDVVETGPKQFKVVLNSIISLSEKKKGESFFTGDVYNHYHDFCTGSGIDILTQRRIGDIVQELEMLGIINFKVISKGRGGRMREIKLVIPKNTLEKVKKVIQKAVECV